MRSYLTNRQQRVQVNGNGNFSTGKNIIAVVPQGSILRLLFFNVFINELFLFVSKSHLSNYAKDNTWYTFGYNLEEIKNVLRFGFELDSNGLQEIVRHKMLINVTLCSLVMKQKIEHLSLYLSLAISFLITAVKRKYMRLLLTITYLLEFTLKFYGKQPLRKCRFYQGY